MTWFKVDDGLPMHPKVEALESFGRAVHAQALALWILAGCDCSHRMTDGTTTMTRLRKLVPWSPNRAVSALVSCGFWIQIDRETYRFHDWTDYQPIAEAIEKRRSQYRKSQAKVRNVNVDRAPPSTEVSTGASTLRQRIPDPVPDPVPDLNVDAAARSATTVRELRLVDRAAAASGRPLVAVLARAYAEAYAGAGHGVWLSWDANGRWLAEVARWARVTASKTGEAPDALCERLVAAAWRQVAPKIPKWDLMAKDPAAYLRAPSGAAARPQSARKQRLLELLARPVGGPNAASDQAEIERLQALSDDEYERAARA